MIGLADTLGISRFPTYNEGGNVYSPTASGHVQRHAAHRVRAARPTIRRPGHGDLEPSMRSRTGCPPTRIASAARAKEMDGKTFGAG